MRGNRVPGTALGILSGDREEHATFGVASANTLVPVDPSTRFQIGSLSKTYTATAIWRLVEDGRITVDAPVRTYLPDLRLADAATASAVTIGNLLDHSGGWWGDEGTYTGEDDDAIARFVAERLPQLPQIFPLGKFFSYNNAGFILLGRVIEVVTGKPYRAAMKDLVLGPLGLTDSTFDPSRVLQQPYADGHYAGEINGTDGIAVQTPLWLPRNIDPAGGLWSTTREVLRYARMHLGDPLDGEPALLSAETRRRMQEPAMDVPGLPLSMGRNWFVQNIGGVRVIIHNGDTLGQHTVFVAIPEQRFALVLLTNSLTGAVATELATIDAAMRAHPGLVPLAGRAGLSRATMAPAGTPTITFPASELAAYSGRFADPGTVIDFSVRGDELFALPKTIVMPNSMQPAIAPAAHRGAHTGRVRDQGCGQGRGGAHTVRPRRRRAGRVGQRGAASGAPREAPVSVRLLPKFRGVSAARRARSRIAGRSLREGGPGLERQPQLHPVVAIIEATTGQCSDPIDPVANGIAVQRKSMSGRIPGAIDPQPLIKCPQEFQPVTGFEVVERREHGVRETTHHLRRAQ